MKTTINLAVISLTGFFLCSPSSAAVISFVASGPASGPQAQGTDLQFTVTGDSNVTFGNSETGQTLFLTDHGDFHFDLGVFHFIYGGGEAGGLDLPLGTVIDATSNYGPNPGFVGTTSFGGGAASGSPTIYGFSMQLAGNTHYGWVEFEESASTQEVIAWAYESNASVGIAAGDTGNSTVPEPSSTLALGLLLGAASFLRRRV